MARSSAELSYRTLEPPWESALALFSFAGAWAPAADRVADGWGAWQDEILCGALLAERAGASAMLHGPVVVTPPDAPGDSAIEIAGHLVAQALERAPLERIDTLFTRPQALDRIWVRAGFIPVPEAELPSPLRNRPGVGLFGWRGGTALWSAAGRGASRPRSLGAR